MKCCEKGWSTTATERLPEWSWCCYAVSQMQWASLFIVSQTLESFKRKTGISLSSSSCYTVSMKREGKHEFLRLHSGPNIFHAAAPGTQLLSSNILALLGLGKETSGPCHSLQEIGKHNPPALCCWGTEAWRMSRNRCKSSSDNQHDGGGISLPIESLGAVQPRVTGQQQK